MNYTRAPSQSLVSVTAVRTLDQKTNLNLCIWVSHWDTDMNLEWSASGNISSLTSSLV